MTEVVTVPRPLLKEFYEHFDKMREILATLEELADKEGLKRIKKGLQEYKKKDSVKSSSDSSPCKKSSDGRLLCSF